MKIRSLLAEILKKKKNISMFYSVKARNEVKSALLMNANEVKSTYVWNSINNLD